MFRTRMDKNYGLLFDSPSESRLRASIHMCCVFMNLTVLWLDNKLVIIDKVLAEKMHCAYSPAKPARYTLEVHQSYFSELDVGDQLELVNAN